jgi:hypothetical protein
MFQHPTRQPVSSIACRGEQQGNKAANMQNNWRAMLAGILERLDMRSSNAWRVTLPRTKQN